MKKGLVVAISSLIAIFSISRLEAQPAPIAEREIEYGKIIDDVQLRQVFQELEPKGQLVTPPIFRYTVKLNATGRLRSLSEPRRSAIENWGKAMKSLDFSSNYSHEIEVSVDEKRYFWLPWQKQLVSPFLEERKNGGSIEIRSVFIGAIKDELLLLTVGFVSL